VSAPRAPVAVSRAVVAPPAARALLAFLLLTVVTLLARDAAAHAVGMSRGDYRVDGAALHVTFVLAGPELAAALPELDPDHDGRVDARELAAGRDALDAALVRATDVRADGRPCAPKLEGTRLLEADAVEVTATFACDHDIHALDVDCRFIDLFSADHRHLATLHAAASSASFVAVPANPHLTFDTGAARGSATFGAMVLMGVRHIWSGYDHLVFLLGLVILGGRVRTLAGMITAFTIAHSLTLGLAVLGVATLPSAVVEPAIALSIAYVGVEDLLGVDVRKRWRITFPFGLVHGFGFAGALVELDLPRAQIPGALVAFNVGVELGQLAVLAALLPLVLWARRFEAVRTYGVKGLSACIVVAGCVLFVMRLV
jgi:hydrogenase/urease accessory protein HupE